MPVTIAKSYPKSIKRGYDFPVTPDTSPRSISIKRTLFTWNCIQDPHRQIKSDTAEYTSTSPTPQAELSHASYTITQDTNHREKRKCKFVRTPLHIGVRRASKTDESSAPPHTPETYTFARCESLCLRYPYVSTTPESSIPSRVFPKMPYQPYIQRNCKKCTLGTQTPLTRAVKLYHEELKPS